MDVGIANDIQYGNPTAPRFVFWEKKLRPTPSGPDVLTFDLLSIGGKLRAGMGLLGLRPKMPGQHFMPAGSHMPMLCATLVLLIGAHRSLAILGGARMLQVSTFKTSPEQFVR